MYSAATAAGVAGQTGELSVLLDLSAPVRGALSFVLVLLVGVGLLIRREDDVHRAVDLTVGGSPVAVVYGLISFCLLAFVGGYIILQLGRISTRIALLQVSLVVAGAAVAVLGGFGYLVVGTWLTEIESVRRPWPGAVIGAGLSALPWAFLPVLPALLGWILLAAVGLGSVTREWVHSEETVNSRSRS